MPGQDYAGTMELLPVTTQSLTDAAATMTLIVENLEQADTMIVDVNAAKGATIDVTRYMDLAQQTEGQAATQGTMADGGVKKLFTYSKISCPVAKIVITKTEAGTGSFSVSVRGAAG